MIEADEAVAIARERAEANGWRWSEPISCELRRGGFGNHGARYEIWTNAESRGTKARFTIDAELGAVIDQGYVAR